MAFTSTALSPSGWPYKRCFQLTTEQSNSPARGKIDEVLTLEDKYISTLEKDKG